MVAKFISNQTSILSGEWTIVVNQKLQKTYSAENFHPLKYGYDYLGCLESMQAHFFSA